LNSSNQLIMNVSLSNDLRIALSNSFTPLHHNSKDNNLHLFAKQITNKARELNLDASSILDELELHSSNNSSSLALLEDFHYLNDSTVVDIDFNSPLAVSTVGGGENWLEDIEKDVSVVKSWEVEAAQLSIIAVAAFQNLKETTNVKEDVTLETVSTLETKADDMYNDIQMGNDMKQSQEHVASVNPILLNDETWRAGGYAIDEEVSSDAALDTVSTMSLKTFKLRDDKQRDLGVSKGERRTRYHTGVIEDASDSTTFEPASIFSYNIGAISQLAKTLERVTSKLTVLSSFFHQKGSSMTDKVSMLKSQTETSGDTAYRSPSQIASEVAALETEAALTRISRLSQSVVASTRRNLMESKSTHQLKQQSLKTQSNEKVGNVESESISAREIHTETSESYLDQLLSNMQAIDKIKNVWNATQRELNEMNMGADTEALIAKEEIHAQADVEREHESTSLELIRTLGKSRIEESVHAVESIFKHLSACLRHIMTPEGQQQFFFYSGVTAVLVFLCFTLKETISLVCIVILRIFTAPRLVREYGNLIWATTRRKHTEPMNEIVLNQDIKDRIDIIVKTAIAASTRRFPLRSLLIHGKSGVGKSLVAKAIAEQIHTLPYALMSGADVYPLGSQGPAELRRLLTWASTRRHGGIIIIDQAETALGSRAAKKKAEDDGTSSSSIDYSRDCLNVLLSMTGTFGNIMLILTSSNPSELDEAVLDRMDEIIHLPLPTSAERKELLHNQFLRQFEKQDDTPPSFLSTTNHLLSKLSGRTTTKAIVDDEFDEDSAIVNLSRKTRGFSGRELSKLLQGISHKCFASDEGVLDIKLWMMESEVLINSNHDKHLLSKSKC